MLYLIEKKRELARRKLSDRSSRGVLHGNTIPEYILIAIFLILVCVGGLQVLSSNVSTAMAKVRDDMKTHQQAAQSVLAAEQAAAAAAANGASGTGAGLTAAQTALLQQSLADKIQTTGANGATELLADQLSAAAELLLAQGKISTSQYDILMQLANQGHQIAQIENLISNAISSANGDTTLLQNMTLVYNGNTYTVSQLAQMIGTSSNPAELANTNVLALDPSQYDSQIASFAALYNEALNSGALSDPAAMSTVTSASQQIGNLAESVEDTVYQVNNTGLAATTAAVQTQVASVASQMDSSSICTAGSFQDNGVLCSP